MRYLKYAFDENGAPTGFSVWDNDANAWIHYYLMKNLQGDVLRVYRAADSALVASYTYDSWGNILTATGDLANINPFRYRGYYYDTETGFYYVSSRYYNPAIGRWINADGQISGVGGDILGCNMFAYCMNNPVNMSDPSGNWSKWFETAAKVVSAVVAVAAVVVTVAAVSAFTAGSGSAVAVYGATVFLGAALSGINGAVANETKGNSYVCWRDKL